MEVDNARLNGSVISFYSTASNTILSVISEDWLIMDMHIYKTVYIVYIVYIQKLIGGR
ncbi:hypothetical protein [Staphylococcus aureus]|uniref:hypothetical protein n=1 Tax=Staphylococcus aureus TaxID=1280 RepID=UPI001662558E|nr:hypothetical protein [Staphylococcus aureus]